MKYQVFLVLLIALIDSISSEGLFSSTLGRLFRPQNRPPPPPPPSPIIMIPAPVSIADQTDQSMARGISSYANQNMNQNGGSLGIEYISSIPDYSNSFNGYMSSSLGHSKDLLMAIKKDIETSAERLKKLPSSVRENFKSMFYWLTQIFQNFEDWLKRRSSFIDMIIQKRQIFFEHLAHFLYNFSCIIKIDENIGIQVLFPETYKVLLAYMEYMRQDFFKIFTSPTNFLSSIGSSFNEFIDFSQSGNSESAGYGSGYGGGFGFNGRTGGSGGFGASANYGGSGASTRFGFNGRTGGSGYNDGRDTVTYTETEITTSA